MPQPEKNVNIVPETTNKNLTLQQINERLSLNRIKGQLHTTLFLPLMPTDIQIPQGYLNTSEVVQSQDGLLFVLRQEKQETRSHVVEHIRSEYEGEGFLGNPQNGFRMRSSSEQQAFAAQLTSSGILTPTIYYTEGGVQIMEFIPDASTLSDLWLRGDPRAIQATVDTVSTMMTMHAGGLVAGDRWGPNEIITKDGHVYLIDFDVEIWGPDAKEFDLANLLYHTSYFVQSGNPKSLTILRDFYLSLLNSPIVQQIYDRNKLLLYMKNYAEFFASEKAQGSPLYYRWNDPQAGVDFFNAIIESVSLLAE